MLPIQISHLLDQAKMNAAEPETRVYYLTGVLFTPEASIELLGIEGTAGAMVTNDPSSHSERIQAKIRIQPGLYQNHVLPWKDRLEMEVNEIKGLKQITRRYRCIPLKIIDTNKESNSTHLTNPEALDLTNFITVDVQLIDLAYEIMKNLPVSDNFLLGNVGDVLHHILTSECQQIPLDSAAKFGGVNIQRPVDNDRVYDHLMVPTGVDLTQIASWMQERYGVYSSGIGSCYYRDFWHVFSLYDCTLYETTSRSMDVIRIPQDVLPTVESSYYINGDHITVLGTGEAKTINKADINHQNAGTGQQLISNTAVGGETGTHYNQGRNVLSRNDSMYEYRTTKRGEGEINDKVKINPTPTNNFCRELSKSRANDGEILHFIWENANPDHIVPGMPVKYFYMKNDQRLVSRQARLVGWNWADVQTAVHGGKFLFRKTMRLILFVGLEEQDEN